jgi:hypothetical protein
VAKKKVAIPKYVLLICLVLGITFDVLFWGKPIGLSFPLFTALLIIVGLWLATQAGVKPARPSLWLLAPIGFFALMFLFRTEPLTLFVSFVATLACLALLAVTFAGAEWPRFGFADYVAKLAGFLPLGALALKDGSQPARGKADRSVAGSIARGLLLVLPLLFVLGFLLSSADAYFADWMQSMFGALSFDKGPEYLVRAVLVAIVAFIIAAALGYALTKSKKHSMIGEEKPLMRPFLGFGEAATMLASVNVLFAVFVAVQFRYFFGGLANVAEGPTGLTFAEYARRGFGELVVVALISLVFYISLSAVTARLRGRQQVWFSGFGIFLFAMVAVMLVSAFQRLLLLEEAYGFTRFRTYPHVFMIWLGLLLLAVVILEARQRQRAFALAVVSACLGFAATLAVINVDNFIVNVNVDRAKVGMELDHRYLGTLSDDAIPALAREYLLARADGNDELANRLEVALACHFASRPGSNTTPEALSSLPWQSFSFSAQGALAEWNALLDDPEYPDVQFLSGSVGTDVSLDDEAYSCYSGEY